MTNFANYDERSIRILSVTDQRERFSFAAAAALAEDYRHVTADFIHRGLTAAMMSGTPREDFVRRYLEGDRSVALPPEFAAVYAELVDEHRRRQEGG